MDIQEIEIIIDKNGKVQVMVRGVAGLQCLDLTRELESTLGGQVDSREMTYEADIPVDQPNRLNQQIKHKS